MQISKFEIFKNSDLFSNWDEKRLEKLAGYFEWLSVSKDQQIISEGDSSDFSIFVVSGCFEVTKKANDGRKLVGIAKPGTMLGEMGLITAEPRYASCRAAMDSKVGLLTQERFDDMGREHPELHAQIVVNIAIELARRLMRVSDSVIQLKEKNDIAVESARRILETAARI